MVVLEGGGMLTTNGNQYIQPDYLSPLPTTVSKYYYYYLLPLLLKIIQFIALFSGNLFFILFFSVGCEEKSSGAFSSNLQPNRS